MRVSETQLKELMTSGLDGDAAAHTALLQALVPILKAFYRRRLGADDDVEDLVQETLISVHTRRATFDRNRPFVPWLYAVAHHRMIDHFRRRKISVPIEEVELRLVAQDFEEAAIAQLDIEALLSGLSSKQAQAIRFTHIEGLSFAEAADRAGISESDVKISVHRGLRRLSARIWGKRP
jgi:RNA polymerase sigma factor (sigma-70 family)